MVSMAIGMAVEFATGSLLAGQVAGFVAGSYLNKGSGTHTEGPRLQNLQVQSSTEGAPIPDLYGTARFAGNVIWSESIKETVHVQEVGGKGPPSSTQTTYTYSCSFAVGLCKGTITGIRRIWADGTLIYNKGDTATADELAVSTQIVITVYTGSETQEPDPTIEADKGVGNVPAYRGLAYVVFTNLHLEKYGNRIPNITCEVVEAGSASSEIVPIEYIEHAIVPPHDIPYFSPQPYYVSSDRVEFYAPQWDFNILYYPSMSTLKKYVYQDGAWSETNITVSSPGIMPNGITDVEGSWWVYPNGVFYNPYKFDPMHGSFCVQNSVAVGSTDYPSKSIVVKVGSNSQVSVATHSEAACSDGNHVYAIELSTGTITKYDLNLNVVKQTTSNIQFYTVYGKSRMRVCDGAIYFIWTLSPYSFIDTKLWRISLDLETIEFLGILADAYSPYDTAYGFNVENGVLTLAYGRTGNPLKIRKYLIGDIVSSNTVELSDVINSLCSEAGVLPDTSSVLGTLHGYVRTNPMTADAALHPLLSAYSISASESDYQLKFSPLTGSVNDALDATDLGASASKEAEPLKITRGSQTELPRRVETVYIDPDGDYQQGNQFAQRVITEN